MASINVFKSYDDFMYYLQSWYREQYINKNGVTIDDFFLSFIRFKFIFVTDFKKECDPQFCSVLCINNT